MGGRYLALFDQRKSVQLSQANFTRSFSLLRRGCSLVHFLTAGGARYITVTSPSVNLDCSASCMIRKQLGVACALLLALRHAALLGLGFLDYLFIYLFIRGLNMTISNIVDIVQCARSKHQGNPTDWWPLNAKCTLQFQYIVGKKQLASTLFKNHSNDNASELFGCNKHRLVIAGDVVFALQQEWSDVVRV